MASSRGSLNICLGAFQQVPGHSGLSYLNVGMINDVIQNRDVIVQALPITHTKSSERWKNVSVTTSISCPLKEGDIQLMKSCMELHASAWCGGSITCWPTSEGSYTTNASAVPSCSSPFINGAFATCQRRLLHKDASTNHAHPSGSSLI